MPNWVYNTLHVHGTPDEITKFKADMSQPIVRYTTPDWKDLSTQVREVVDVDFSYMNVISPWDEGISEDEYFATHGFSNGVSSGDTPGNWYNWNNQNWGVKWDCDAGLEADEAEYVSYAFDSPWGPPTPVIEAIAAKYPTMTFSHDYEEEQGWGGEVEYANGVAVYSNFYDIPESHQDYVARDREGSCICAYEDDPTEFYPDCPNYVEA